MLMLGARWLRRRPSDYWGGWCTQHSTRSKSVIFPDATVEAILSRFALLDKVAAYTATPGGPDAGYHSNNTYIVKAVSWLCWLYLGGTVRTHDQLHWHFLIVLESKGFNVMRY